MDVNGKLVLREALATNDAERALATSQGMGLHRPPTIGLLDRIWERRRNVSADDAAYVARAETLDCRLVTADQRLAAADGPCCPIEIVPR